MSILGPVTKKYSVKKLENHMFNIVFTQGLNRQIRRMCTYLDYEVTALNRLRIMNIDLGKLKMGIYQNFTEAELHELSQLVADSCKTQDASE